MENQEQEQMSLDKLVEFMKEGKPYIAPNEHFTFVIMKVEIKTIYKMQYKVIPLSETLALDEEVVNTLHEMFNTIEDRVSHWVKRGFDNNGKEFIEFELSVKRPDKKETDNPDQIEIPFNPDKDDQSETQV